ncbi:MAG: hypothetical protein LBP70_04050 [Mycoplasmataceae bacterium]|nr:hypothetical protein [Mycoplasmataceae bacterium]
MRKFKWILLNIITFGILYIYVKHQAKKNNAKINDQLQISDKVDFKLDDLIEDLGGVDNILDSSATMSTLKINLKNAETLTKEKFAKYKIHGFMKNTNQVILVFGDNAQVINVMLQEKIMAH